ncbi:uncharacterized protein C8A04DRAFT_14786 [Dichotomopilus funicola]|uniref:Uncharacterized protein n=1 Tax=Dichotomopilus funicola TaxID=1934379 RepID=A0AAN6ZJY5_9PEZI|nr:hypothetical protein C8A04DRAFT_14786 [Dichotomopilus funicola]
MAHQGNENSAHAESSTSQTVTQALPIEARRPLFPPVMNGYGQWGKQRGFNLCGETEKDRLHHVAMHSGYGRSEPLGSRPGVVLHQGMDTKTPILAAAGYDSQFSARLYSFNQTVVLMPSLLPAAERTSEFDTEQMPATVRGEQVVFSFFIEVDHGKERQRQKFEWRKFEKGKIAAATEGGFELVRVLSPGSSRAGQEPGASSASLSSTSEEEDEELGERWALMVVITAIRLWILRLHGKTKKGVIVAGQKLASS